jgi:hypothetical protein
MALDVYSSNFDFTIHDNPTAAKLFKLHGTIEKDVVDGGNSRIIISESDYDQTSEYREQLYDRLGGDLAGGQLIIIGHSLADPDIREIVNRAAAINVKASEGGQIVLFLFSKDEDRASLYEKRGLTVCFGGIDEFFAEMTHRQFGPTTAKPAGDLLDYRPALRPFTLDVEHESNALRADVSSMFNGWPATHADILAGLTFDRSVALSIFEHFKKDEVLFATLLGASGVGKTTAARQAVQHLRQANVICWEHKSDLPLSVEDWFHLAEHCRAEDKKAVLVVDDAHSHLYELNELADSLAASKNFHMKLLLVATRHQWNPRVKTPTLYRYGGEFKLVQLSQEEIERLLVLLDVNASIRSLVEPMFSGFSRQERKRRLVERCEKDMFVCLKSIFASESFDDIILREYAGLEPHLQDIYRYVAAMENAGVRVHRQLLVRLLRIPATTIAASLEGLTDIVAEYTIDKKQGIYGWQTRHAVIADIIARFKFSDISKVIELLELVIDNLRPTYDIEVRTIRELCNYETGIPRIPDKETQNRLLRRMMSVAPGERVPRHRLIRNLIDSGAYEKAETEIRIFEKDFGIDGPVYRYKVNLLVSRAVHAPGILIEDRIQILEQGRELALVGIRRFQYNKALLAAYAELGLEYFKLAKTHAIFDEAIELLKKAEQHLADPDVSRTISRLMRRVQGHAMQIIDDTDLEATEA